MTETLKYRYTRTNFFCKIILIIIAGINPSVSFLCAQRSSDTVPPGRQIQPSFAGSHNYNNLLTEAMTLQNRIDYLAEQAHQYRQEILYQDNVSERNRLQFQLGILDEKIQSLQAEADSLFIILSRMTELEEEQNSLLILDTVIEGIKVYHYNTQVLKSGDAQKERSAESTNIFSILKEPAYSSDRPFEYDFQIPPGVFYRIQMAAYSQEPGRDKFGGIQPVTVEPTDDGKLFKYFAGKFSNYSEADSALSRIRAAGFRDAFIVGYYDGHRMSTEQVREFERSER